ncbi:MAG: SIMPL domain-containing protein [Nanoarchaeota archaeon]
MEGKYFLIGIAVLALLVGGYLFYGSGPEISTQGVANVKVQPDTLGVYMNVMGKGKTMQDAKAEHDKIVVELKSKLRSSGFKDSEIQTLNYNVYQDYDYSTRTPVSKGYVVSEQVIVKTEDFDRAGDIVDRAIESNTLVQSINFELSQEKQNEMKAEALKQAGMDAENKANAIASGLNKKVGRLVSVSSQEFNYGGPIAYYEKAVGGVSSDLAIDNSEAVRVAQSVNPSEMEISAYINARYKLR